MVLTVIQGRRNHSGWSGFYPSNFQSLYSRFLIRLAARKFLQLIRIYSKLLVMASPNDLQRFNYWKDITARIASQETFSMPYKLSSNQQYHVVISERSCPSSTQILRKQTGMFIKDLLAIHLSCDFYLLSYIIANYLYFCKGA